MLQICFTVVWTCHTFVEIKLSSETTSHQLHTEDKSGCLSEKRKPLMPLIANCYRKSQTIVLLSFAYATIGNSLSDGGVNNTGLYSTFRSRTWSVLGAFMILVFVKSVRIRGIYMYRKPILGKKISILKHGFPTFRYQVLITISVALIHLFCFLCVGSGDNFTWEK